MPPTLRSRIAQRCGGTAIPLCGRGLSRTCSRCVRRCRRTGLFAVRLICCAKPGAACRQNLALDTLGAGRRYPWCQYAWSQCQSVWCQGCFLLWWLPCSLARSGSFICTCSFAALPRDGRTKAAAPCAAVTVAASRPTSWAVGRIGSCIGSRVVTSLVSRTVPLARLWQRLARVCV